MNYKTRVANVRRDRGGTVARDNPLLAARLPGGTASVQREVSMWKRSEVERLTGLERHVIQNLCNKNTSQDGLGFWEPAVMKPGYSRFDEGDLLAFYLVRKLVGAGFSQREIGAVVESMLEGGDAFSEVLRAKSHALIARRRQVEARLESLERLEMAAERRPENRLYDVMGRELLASARHAVDEACGELGGSIGGREQARDALQGLAREVWRTVCGEKGNSRMGRFFKSASRLVSEGADPEGPESQGLMRGLVALMVGGGSGRDDEEGGGLTTRALELFLRDPENGVPIELSFGKGSFAYLGKAASVLAETDSCNE